MNGGKLLVSPPWSTVLLDWGTTYHSQIIGFERLSNCEYIYFLKIIVIRALSLCFSTSEMNSNPAT